MKTGYGKFRDAVNEIMKNKSFEEKEDFFKVNEVDLATVLSRLSEIFALLRNKVSTTITDHELENMILEQIALTMYEDNVLVHILNEYRHALSIYSWKKIYIQHYGSPLMSIIRKLKKEINKYEELGMDIDNYVFDFNILIPMINMYKIYISSLDLCDEEIREYLKRTYNMINSVCESPIERNEFIIYVMGEADIYEDFHKAGI
ncbi:MAG: hypothetical protein ACOCRK_02935 [bacterium]